MSTERETQWFAVTFRGTAEMVVWTQAGSAAEAREKADDGDYADATDVEFVKGRPYTMKARPAPDYQPSAEYGP